MDSLKETLEGIIGYPAHRVTDSSIVFACPFADVRHEKGIDKNPSFSYNIEDNYYYCFSCHSSGTVARLKSDLNSDIDIDGIKKTLKRKSILDNKIDDEPPLDKEIYLNIFDDPWESNSARQYIQSRNISKETVEKLGIGFDSYRDILTFPIYDKEKNLYGFQGRKLVEDDRGKILTYCTKLKNKFLGMEFYDRKKPFLLVEGLFGYSNLHEIGASTYFNILCIMGSKLPSEKAQVLKDLPNHIFILPDNDKAGRACIYDGTTLKLKPVIEKLTKTHKIYLPEWPSGKHDPDQLSLDDIKKMRYNTKSIESVTQFKLF